MSCTLRSRLPDFLANRLAAREAQEFQAHLATCADCRAEGAVKTVLAAYRPYAPSDTDWQRLDRAVLSALDSAVAPLYEESWFTRFMPAFSFAAAAAAAVLLTVSLPGTATDLRAFSSPAPQAGALATAMGSACQVLGQSGELRPLTTPSLAQGERVLTGDGTLTVQTAAATGVRVGASSDVELATLSPLVTELRVLSGELFAEVKPLEAGSSFRVRAGDLLVTVRGTAFRVVREARAVRVEVAHGLVSVEREGAGDVMVPGPGSVEIEDGAPIAQDAVARAISPATEAAFPLALPDRALLDLAREAPAMIAPPTPVEEKRPEAIAAARPEPQKILAPRVNPRLDALRSSLAACLGQHQRDLAACYEHAQKIDPNLPTLVTFEVAIDRSGSVRSLATREPMGGFVDCARETFRRCEQPGIGEDVRLEIPFGMQLR
jgi:hypothetical protein